MGAYLLLFSVASLRAEVKPFQLGVAAGFNRLISQDVLARENSGAEIGILTYLPFQIFNESANLVTVRAQYTRYNNDLIFANASGDDTVRLFFPSHSQLKFDFRQIFQYWGIGFSLGLGLQLPVSTSVLTPLGRFTFREAATLYPQSKELLAKIETSHAVYVRVGIDQKFLDDALLAGIGIDVNILETPKTLQRYTLNVYAGARIW